MTPSDSLFARLGAAIPDFIIATGFLVTWYAPFTFGEKIVSYLMLVMLLEFLIVHSSGFMGTVLLSDTLSRSRQVLALLGLGAFYLLFAGGFALAFAAWWPIWTILLLTLNRILAVFLGSSLSEKEQFSVQAAWAVSVLFYVGFAFLTTLLPIPALGITSEIVRIQDFSGGGLWIDEPQRVIAFGALYFFATGCSECFGSGFPLNRLLSPSRYDIVEKRP